ncbi:MAG: serine hydrolase [bacterium]|nr:serine hydrolase [bacterium]
MNFISRFKNQRSNRGGREIRLSFVAGVLLLAALGWFGFRSFIKAASEIGFLQGASSANLQDSFAQQQKLQELLLETRPTNKSDQENFSLLARSGISVFVDGERTKTLFSQQADKQVPIASLTKLITAFAVLEHYDLTHVVTVSEEAVGEEGEGGFLRPGDRFTVRQLLYPLLIESSNDAASALAEVIGKENFVELMNREAENLGLQETVFINPTGLDPNGESNEVNRSSARDIARLAEEIALRHPEAFSILEIKTYDLFDAAGHFHHTLFTTNELLGYTEWPTQVLGGKTGWTPKAKGNLLLVLRAPKERGMLFDVVLGADDRFGQMKSLVDWVYTSYLW